MANVYPFSERNCIERAALLWAQLREKRPRVHCITNAAAQVFTANLLLAAFAIPSLTIASEEVPFFVTQSAALLVNLGTLDAERSASIPVAIATAQRAQKPWVLDPVFVESSPPRLQTAIRLLALEPTILRCNADEFEALSGVQFDAESLAHFAQDKRVIMALTGTIDYVTDGTRLAMIGNGHPVMRQTTAMGCAGTALIAAFAALDDDPLMAATGGLLVLGVAGEIAAAQANGPGSFVPAFLDTLAALTPEQLTKTARLTIADIPPMRVSS